MLWGLFFEGFSFSGIEKAMTSEVMALLKVMG
jgi:hypothetical protein